MDEITLGNIEQLRVPTDDESSPVDWKDWYHFILIEPKSGVRVLANLTLSGRPGRGEIRISNLGRVIPQITHPLKSDRPFLIYQKEGAIAFD